ncbi:MAG: hypothetical protein QOD74_980, partial [Variibacter sp.]|nr:hypothetical protein [Variibacter sp.]
MPVAREMLGRTPFDCKKWLARKQCDRGGRCAVQRGAACFRRNNEQAVERDVVAAETTGDLLDDMVRDPGPDDRRLKRDISRGDHEHRSIHNRLDLRFRKPLRERFPVVIGGIACVAADHPGES